MKPPHKCEFINDAQYNTNDDIEIIVSSTLMLGVFIIAMLAISNNIVKYLIRQKWYKEFHASFFYALATVITLLRITFFIQCIVYSTYSLINDSHNLNQAKDYFKKTHLNDQVCQFFEIILGIQQIGSMFELSLILQSYRPHQQEPDARIVSKKIRFQRYWIISTSFIVLLAVPLFLFMDQKNSIKTICTPNSYTTKAYMVATIGDCVCVLILLVALTDLLYKGELNQHSGRDARKIRSFVILFCSTFAIRAIVNVLRIKKTFPVVPIFDGIGSVVLWTSQYLIYNILPIMYLVKTHHDTFKPRQKSRTASLAECESFTITATENLTRSMFFFHESLLQESRKKISR